MNHPPAKKARERMSAMRAARDALGLRRLELYARPEDVPAIQQFAIKLQMRRAKLAKQKAG